MAGSRITLTAETAPLPTFAIMTPMRISALFVAVCPLAASSTSAKMWKVDSTRITCNEPQNVRSHQKLLNLFLRHETDSRTLFIPLLQYCLTTEGPVMDIENDEGPKEVGVCATGEVGSLSGETRENAQARLREEVLTVKCSGPCYFVNTGKKRWQTVQIKCKDSDSVVVATFGDVSTNTQDEGATRFIAHGQAKARWMGWKTGHPTKWSCSTVRARCSYEAVSIVSELTLNSPLPLSGWTPIPDKVRSEARRPVPVVG